MVWPCFEIWDSLGQFGDLRKNISDSASWFLIARWTTKSMSLWTSSMLTCGISWWIASRRRTPTSHQSTVSYIFYSVREDSAKKRWKDMNGYISLQKKLSRFVFSHFFPFSCALSLEQRSRCGSCRFDESFLSILPSTRMDAYLLVWNLTRESPSQREPIWRRNGETTRSRSKICHQFSCCLVVHIFLVFVLWQEEVERLREIIERLKEENEQLTRQLEVWLCDSIQCSKLLAFF